jgi:hypothetical protein
MLSVIILNVVILNVVMLSVIMLRFILLSVVILNVVMLSVVAPRVCVAGKTFHQSSIFVGQGRGRFLSLLAIISSTN